MSNGISLTQSSLGLKEALHSAIEHDRESRSLYNSLHRSIKLLMGLKTTVNEDNKNLSKRIKNIQFVLQTWSKKNFGDCHEKIKALEFRLLNLHSGDVNNTNLKEEEDIEREIFGQWLRQELIWHQRSKETL
uniref:Uncharacterized protein n=1 Tax=Cannabis sativa TaxID=3483 RepID=A0A803QRP4_CANSA